MFNENLSCDPLVLPHRRGTLKIASRIWRWFLGRARRAAWKSAGKAAYRRDGLCAYSVAAVSSSPASGTVTITVMPRRVLSSGVKVT